MNSRILAIGAIVLMLLIGGAGFAFYSSKMNKDEVRLVKVPVAEIPDAQRELLVKQWAALSDEEEILRKVVDSQGLAAAWGGGDQAAAILELKKRKFIELSPDQQSVNIAVRGKRKDRALLNASSTAIFKEIQAFLIAHKRSQSER